jgi:hypothetical protein
VLAAGGKLPPPISLNALLNKYHVTSTIHPESTEHYRDTQGSVLVVQGVLDPLNDARARAEMLARVKRRRGRAVKVRELFIVTIVSECTPGCTNRRWTLPSCKVHTCIGSL